MKRRLVYLLLLVMSMGSALFAQTAFEPTGFIPTATQPVATTDGMLAPLINPAALGFGNSDGIGYMQFMDDKKLQDHYWLLANLQGLSYVYEKSEVWNALQDKWKDMSTHTLATGSELFTPFKLPNLYAGTAFQWNNNHFKEGGFKSGVLYRPVPSASLGFVWNNPYKAAPSYQAGIGIRPFSFLPVMKQYRLELNADVNYSKDSLDAEHDYTMWKPTVGASVELIDGVRVGANYDMENKATMFNFSLSGFNTQIGTLFHAAPHDRAGLGYVFASDKAFKPIAGMHGKNWYTLPIKSNVVTYKGTKYKIGPFKLFDNKMESVEEVIKDIEKAKKDDSIQGILFVNKNFSASMALKQEILEALRSFKAEGKYVAFYYDNMRNGDYIFAASIADKIYLDPQGTIDLKGIAVSSPYLKDTLNALGIDVYNFRSHPTKTAGNMFSEDEMIPEERAMYESLLSDMYNQICDDITAGRGSKLTKPIRETIDAGPYYLAEDAYAAGLVDNLVYEANLNDKLKADFHFTGKTRELPQMQNYTWSHSKQAKVAIIYAQGNIVMGEGEVGQKIGHDTTAKLIRKARKNPEYKGIILRVDSGGGSAQASDIIYHEIELAKTENKKPVVVSMSGVAGSGGYYIACNSDYIYADPATITGSIGVIGITFSAERLFDKLRVNWGTVKKGQHSDFGSINRQWTEDEKAIMSHLIETSYHDFVGKVARGRHKEYDEIDPIAQGKVWTGNQALELGLVDGLGGLKDAKAKIKELAHIKGEVVLEAPAPENKMSLEMGIGISGSTPIINSAALNAVKDYIQLYDDWAQYESNAPLYLSPIDLNQLSGK